MKLELGNFRSWMGSEAKLAPSTRQLYTDFVHALLHDHDSAVKLLANPTDLVRLAVEYEAHLLSGSRNTFRCAVRAFARYALARQGVTIPFAFPKNRPTSVLGPFLRAFEAQHVPFGHVERIRWRDVKRNGSKGELHDRLRGDYYLVPIEAVQGLNLWAGGGERAHVDQPLVPIEPKSFTPMSAKRLMRLARGS